MTHSEWARLRLRGLQRQARSTAAARGHDLSSWAMLGTLGERARANCMKCGMQVNVNVKPA